MWKKIKNLWVSICLWMAGITSKPSPEDDDLTDDECQCGHNRCVHHDGRHECSVNYGPSKENPGWVKYCACKVFIRKGKRGGDDPIPVTPSVDELERMFK